MGGELRRIREAGLGTLCSAVIESLHPKHCLVFFSCPPHPFYTHRWQATMQWNNLRRGCCVLAPTGEEGGGWKCAEEQNAGTGEIHFA